ncbi:MAG TPA: pentapeptide repeat-containing protein, partial [Cyanobacteria bacterium UBA11367]|nr:pentapeptide repeat-containing protein [Cyanobacteria bacterium UBA11367]
MKTQELLNRYAAREVDFREANLAEAILNSVNLSRADLSR